MKKSKKFLVKLILGIVVIIVIFVGIFLAIIPAEYGIMGVVSIATLIYNMDKKRRQIKYEDFR